MKRDPARMKDRAGADRLRRHFGLDWRPCGGSARSSGHVRLRNLLSCQCKVIT
jgi:hypothetical protein